MGKEKNTKIRPYKYWQTRIPTCKDDLQRNTKNHVFTPPHRTLTHTYKQYKHSEQSTLRHTCMTIDTTKKKTRMQEHTHTITQTHTNTHTLARASMHTHACAHTHKERKCAHSITQTPSSQKSAVAYSIERASTSTLCSTFSRSSEKCQRSHD